MGPLSSLVKYTNLMSNGCMFSVILSTYIFNIGGGAKGAIYTGILPEGLDIYLDDPNNPTTASISGTLNTGDSASNIYNFTITTTSNQDGCSEASFNACLLYTSPSPRD